MNLKGTLCTFSGDDYSIIRECDKGILFRFIAIGAFVTLIFILCFMSSYFTFTKLFDDYFISLPISIFFAWMITNIYLLILYTLSKNSFPHLSDNFGKLISVSIRVIFICFISVIVSKPIEALLFSIPLENDIEQYKQEQIKKYTKSTTEYFNEETKNLKLIIEKQTSQVENYKMLVQKKEFQKGDLISKMTKRVTNSNYYIQRIIILSRKHKACWFITFLTLIIFLTPAYLKNFIGEHTDYYNKKNYIENRLVNEEYASFKEKYNLIFQQQFNKNLQYSEPFVNPPFNTVRKKDEREFLKEDDLIFDLYNA